MRLEGQAKGGYFPTPPSVVEIIARSLVDDRPSFGDSIWLDPCCGEGDALAQLKSLMPWDVQDRIKTYGVELYEERAEVAKEKLDHVLEADAFNITMSRETVDLLWLNPPYDFDEKAGRVEHKFLLKYWNYLAPQGILFYIIPRRALARSTKFIAQNGYIIQTINFPSPEIEAYDQIVVTAKKGDGEGEFAVDRMMNFLYSPISVTNSLQHDPHEFQVIRPSMYRMTHDSENIMFEVMHRDPEEVLAMMRERGLWHDGRVWDKLVPRDVVKEQPLMPLRKGHLALLVAAGFLNNCRLQQDGRPKLVKGQMSKSMVMNEERTNGNTEVFEERMNVSLWVLDLLAGDFTEVGM